MHYELNIMLRAKCSRLIAQASNLTAQSFFVKKTINLSPSQTFSLYLCGQNKDLLKPKTEDRYEIPYWSTGF